MRFRRAVQIGVLTGIVAGAGLFLTTFHGCASADATRSARLLTMAATEASEIDVLEERLTRQLNIADLQIQNEQKKEAAKTLALATSTLRARVRNDKDVDVGIDGVKLISGWTSVAELSHRADEAGSARDAYAEAEKALNAMEPVSKRAEFVLSLSEVCENIHGKAEAGKLLVKGGEWAKQIDSIALRRYALSTFSHRLVRYDDLESARVVMRNEKDARWRSDTLAAIARQTMSEEKSKGGGPGFGGARDSAVAMDRGYAASVTLAEPPRSPATSVGKEADAMSKFNQNVRYDFNYRNAEMQSGLMPR